MCNLDAEVQLPRLFAVEMISSILTLKAPAPILVTRLYSVELNSRSFPPIFWLVLTPYANVCVGELIRYNNARRIVATAHAAFVETSIGIKNPVTSNCLKWKKKTQKASDPSRFVYRLDTLPRRKRRCRRTRCRRRRADFDSRRISPSRTSRRARTRSAPTKRRVTTCAASRRIERCRNASTARRESPSNRARTTTRENSSIYSTNDSRNASPVCYTVETDDRLPLVHSHRLD